MYLHSLADLKVMAEELAKKAQPPLSFLLFGDVGTGKTTFSQFFIKSVLIDKAQSVSSPTYNIIQIYETTAGLLWHVDLYRIKEKAEIFELGLFEAMNENICLIEWPEIIIKYTKRYNCLSLNF
jgi:tRNA threonylcarbamoyladenosine biosynthesis protein TsaE